jgi:uncharacterized protein YrrD
VRKGKTVIGQDVLSLNSGRRVHSVKDLIIGDSTQIVALLVDEGGLLSTSTIVPIDAVRRFGKDAVVIADDTAVVPASADPRVAGIINRRDSLVGKRVFSVDGQEMGSVADMYFDEASGRIDGLEISRGALENIARGPSYLAADEIELAGSDIVFIRPDTAAQLSDQVSGVQGALHDATDRASEAASGLQEDAQAKSEDAQRRREQEREEALVGQRSGTEVTDENGAVVVAKGQRITSEIVKRARATGNLPVLLQAADVGQAEESQEKHAETTEELGDSARDVWDRFTAKLAEVTDSTGQRGDEQQLRSRLAQISDAIGRPVTKVILDRNDEVVLDLGDIITHQAVQQAHEAGMLDTLLACVYRGQVEFTRDEMKSRQQATASVERASGGAAVVEDLAKQVETAEAQRHREREEARRQAEQEREQRASERRHRADRRAAARAQRDADVVVATNGPATHMPIG